MNDFEAGSSADDEPFDDPAALGEGDEVVRQFVEHWGVNDDLGLVRQLGAIPTAGEPVGSLG